MKEPDWNELYNPEEENKIDLSHHYIRPKKPVVIEGTPFHRNALNLVYAPSFAGKSFTIAETLVDAGLNGTDVIWLDADHNINSDLLDMLETFTCVNTNIGAAMNIILSATNPDGRIVVFDSLKDFAGKHDLDTNQGSEAVMKDIREFVAIGYTVIVIAHATYTDIVKTDFKIKGNEEVIKSKSDLVLKLEDAEFYDEKNRAAAKESMKEDAESL